MFPFIVFTRLFISKLPISLPITCFHIYFYIYTQYKNIEFTFFVRIRIWVSGGFFLWCLNRLIKTWKQVNFKYLLLYHSFTLSKYIEGIHVFDFKNMLLGLQFQKRECEAKKINRLPQSGSPSALFPLCTSCSLSEHR